MARFLIAVPRGESKRESSRGSPSARQSPEREHHHGRRPQEGNFRDWRRPPRPAFSKPDRLVATYEITRGCGYWISLHTPVESWWAVRSPRSPLATRRARR